MLLSLLTFLPKKNQVHLEQGLQMLKIFKEHVSKTSILDDFVFYESRQKLMQSKRVKQQQVQKQVRLGLVHRQFLHFSSMPLLDCNIY
jgi:hypothetical protein